LIWAIVNFTYALMLAATMSNESKDIIRQPSGYGLLSALIPILAGVLCMLEPDIRAYFKEDFDEDMDDRIDEIGKK